MKKIMFAAALLLSAVVQAQDVKMRPAGKVEMVVSYKLDQLCDYPNQWRNSEWREESTLILETGEGRAHSYVNEERNTVLKWLDGFKKKNHWWTSTEPHALVGETFIEKGKLTQVVNLDAAGIFLYTEAVPRLKWKIEPERKQILGYNCQRATCSFRGRDFEAWFAEEIPVSFGPWKLGGLPGLILEASDTKNEYRFTADGIEKTEREMLLIDEELRPIKRERALKMEAMLHRDHGSYTADYGITFRLEGMEHDPLPYHPLELK